jgi:DNA-binding MarR family transcriptional regulator
LESLDHQLLTIRQYLFLKWLYKRKIGQEFCELSDTDIQCFNCLQKKNDCLSGVIPASYFAKKIKRQFSDCKRVLDTLVALNLVAERAINAKEFRVFYEITQTGIQSLDQFETILNIREKPELKKN